MRPLRRVAAGLIGAEWEAKLWEKCERTYTTNHECILDQYSESLCTTKPLALAYARHEDKVEPSEWNRSGIRVRLEVTESWPPEGYVPVMTREEFSALFRLKGIFWTGPESPLPEPDDGGLFDRTVGALRHERPCYHK